MERSKGVDKMSAITKENMRLNLASGPEVKVIAERCVGCQECIIRCPTQAISMNFAEWIASVDHSLCVGCRQCERTCPFSAIRVEGPLVVAERNAPSPPVGQVTAGDVTDLRPGFANLDEAVKEAQRCLNCPDPTCMRGCPAHNDIPGFIEAIRNKDLERAMTIILETSCLPDICSRVCNWPSQCEGACSWALAGGQPVAIGKLEQFVADNTRIPPLKPLSHRGQGLSVGIIGSGPAGIAAAWELASAGASVTIYERGAAPGGVIQWGIPLYVLPDKVAQRPVQALVDDGIKFRLNTQVTPEMLTDLFEKHDAVIAALGAPVPERPRVPGESLEGVIDATTFLTRARKALIEGMILPEIRGKHVLVLGGSNTAIDVARNILRLGGKPIIIHRREERFSRARPDEIADAKREGVEFRFATNIARLEGQDGKLKRAVLVTTRQNRAGSATETVKGTEQSLEVNILVVATGYSLDSRFSELLGRLPVKQPLSDRLLPDRRWLGSGILTGKKQIGNLAWEREYGLRISARPRRQNLWIVGDALIGPSTVVGSMAQGRSAARAILQRHSGQA
jgi:glutamate synthase (NADPH/NADH) small chain